MNERARRVPAGAAVLQEDVTAAITAAFFREWARVGYAALSIEAVARRAGVGKAAVYRRWPSKLAMASELLLKSGIRVAQVPDTGSLEGDVRALLEGAHRLLRRPLVRRILPDLHAEMRRSAPLARAIRGGLQLERRAMGEALVRRAIARGELPASIDVDLVLDLLPAVLYWRLIVTGMETPPGYLEDLQALTLGALRGLAAARG
ncbi:TetR family transcriptional regulator [Sorangium cellulosum]|uniref:TetR family transcriptional regulator n=1 Tax=Sorangium cellulosum TaxID=56 RepID=A0A2L0F8X6_SORCE|nr:TetR/AcrR family transcriptional regulator [Sorangium cellulosum]AUX47993.1 TetR family transcriptional regulator [Sorangium cellulosum]